MDHFLARDWKDVKSGDPAEDAKLLAEVKIASTRSDQLFNNLLKRISGGVGSHEVTHIGNGEYLA